MAQLPPKIPNMQQHNCWPDHFSHQQRIMPSLPPTSFAPISITTASTTTTTTNPYWVDEFLDFSAARRASQRRSVSDSVTFLEMPMLEEYRGGSVGNNAAAAVQPGPVSRSSSNTDKNNNHHIHQSHLDMFEDDHFISMLKDEFSGAGVPPTISPSDHNSINDDEKEHPSRKLQQYLKNENEEVESECISGTQSVQNAATTTSGGSSDIVDSKRVKRILANRQSAQRSRVRKLQYISELERSVTSLQAEVSVLSPRVAFLDHQRLILNVDNSALKQRIAALTQDKIFKDAHQEALKREIERLRQVYEQQNLKNMENKATQSHSSSSIVDASKLPADKDQQPLNVSS